MMSTAEFREMALGFPEAEEGSHMDHPDFRTRGKIFATLGPGEEWGMVKLTPTQQQEFLRISRAFKPAAGKWGEAGATIISLEIADAADVHKALLAAWQNLRDKRKSSRKT
ncbi:MAG TPA: MmcQ/YjbR family DNA-binding protein [Pyrinomonadaceae bacterium]|nr:MmcQ/YjbR family DNA-binding protein [Pyrinomonadaceae bacterium]